jgi:PspAB-like protein
MGFFGKLKRVISNSTREDHDRVNDKIHNPETDSSAISSLARACIRLEDNLGLKSTGRCSICVKNVDTETFRDMKQYVENFLNIASDKKDIAFHISFHSLVDDFGYLWFILEGKEMSDIVVALDSVGDTIHEKGFSNQLLAAAFEFTSGYGSNTSDTSYNKQYLIYNYKLDKFYPFVPIASANTESETNKRDNGQEMKIMKEIEAEIPFEKDLSLWYPIWNIPIK